MELEQTHKMDHDLHPHIPHLRGFHSTKELHRSPLYQKLRPKIEQVFRSYELVNSEPIPAVEPYYRCVSWNIERGMRFEAILHFLRNHPILSKADILLLTETDYGMARSGNRNVAGEIAKELKMNYFFAPSYLNLAKGCGIEQEVDGENKLGIAGNAILSRYPISHPEVVSLPNAHDKMKGREKRLGSQSAAFAYVHLPGGPIVVSATHLDVRSTQEHRRQQLEQVLKRIEQQGDLPALVGGDWNTSTYNAQNARSAIIGFWIRVGMGVSNMIRNHYPHPYRRFEKRLFRMLDEMGFDYRECNELGVGTSHYSVADIKQYKNLKEWLPEWCFKFIEWALKKHDGRMSFKLDWFTQKKLSILREEESRSDRKGASLGPKVVGGLHYDNYPASDHDPIVVDFVS